MKLALTTRWNANRHSDGEEMIEEIRKLGFERVELGYDLRLDLVEGVKRAVAADAISVTSLHNFCPVPTAAPAGHPELFTLADSDKRMRDEAVRHTTNTIRFAAEMGAKVVVMHSGNVAMRRITPKLFALAQAGDINTKRYEKMLLKLLAKRQKKGAKHLEFLYRGLEQLLPVLEENDVILAMENLPTWEAIPTEPEMESILQYFDSPHLGYWHDMGHGQVRQNVRLTNALNWLERLKPHLAGMHVHDVIAPASDHVMPPKGEINFDSYSVFASMDIPLVVEPTPRTSADDIKVALEFLTKMWK